MKMYNILCKQESVSLKKYRNKFQKDNSRVKQQNATKKNLKWNENIISLFNQDQIVISQKRRFEKSTRFMMWSIIKHQSKFAAIMLI